MLIISIEGNIGAGKSTLLANIQQEFNSKDVCICHENIEEWNKFDDGKTILSRFYEDPQSYGFLFQLITLNSIANSIKNAINKRPKVIILERSPYSNHFIFAQSQFNCGNISALEFQFYQKLLEESNHYVTTMIHLTTPPNLCLQRIGIRNREGEQNISIEYLKLLDEAHCHMTNAFPGKVYKCDNKSAYTVIQNLIYTQLPWYKRFLFFFKK